MSRRRGSIGPTAILACAALLLDGWAGLLVPSLVRQLEADFGQSDAGVGAWFFVNAVAYASGSVVGGLLTERLGRRVVLTVAVLLLAVGLAGVASVPTWGLMLVAAVPFGMGGGAIDGGSNGLILDLYPTTRGRALNLLHLFFAVGALASPLVVGRLVEGGVAWQAIVLGTAFAAVPLAVLLLVIHMPSGRHVAVHGASTVRVGLALPLVLLAIAIACYVGSEVGVSNWLVRFLDAAPLGLATSALALFWGCLTLGRLASAAWSDRFDHARFAAVASVVAAVALIGAVIVPSLAVSIVLFGVVGFAFGPIYPLIMAVAGDRYPARTAAISGFLSGFAVVGAIVYPPLMGFVSVAVGLGVAMAGAAGLVLACGIALLLVGRRAPAVVEPGAAGQPATRSS